MRKAARDAAAVACRAVGESAARMVAWAPDDVRELLAGVASGGDEHDDVALAHTRELMAKAFAITGAWELAREGYGLAADSWRPHDPTHVRARRAREAIAARAAVSPRRRCNRGGAVAR